MFISASCAVIVGSIITCIVRFLLWLSLFLSPSALFTPLCMFVCRDDTMSLWVCLHSPSWPVLRLGSSSVFHFA